VLLLGGPEAFLRNSQTAELRKKLEKQHGEVDVVTFDGATTQAAEVLDECRSFGLMATHKLVIVDQFDELIRQENRAAFERYAESPPEGATLVLRSKSAAMTGNFEKSLHAAGVLSKCEAMAEGEAIRWVSKHAKQEYRAELEPAAAAALVGRVGTSMMQLHSELGKLAAASGAGGKIGPALVAEFVGVSREEQAFAIQRSLLASEAGVAISHLRHIVGVSRQPATLVMFAMTDLARKLHGLSAGMKAGRSPGELGKALRLWGPGTEMLTNVARKTPPARTLLFLRACLKADERVKTGLADDERVLEMMVIRMHRILIIPS
jgi:DNA polymerase III subunit delta